MNKSQNSRKVAIIFGATGQIGSYLSDYLLDLGYGRVVGVARRVSNTNVQRLSGSLLNPKFVLAQGDITDPFSLLTVFSNNINDKNLQYEVYNLAAASHVHTSFNQPKLYADITGIGHLNILETCLTYHRLKYDLKVYFQGSSVSGETPVLVDINNNKKLINIKDLYDLSLNKENKIKCLTLDKNYKTKWSDVSYVFTHKANNLYRVRGSGGLDIKITGNHSVMVLDDDGNLIEKRVDELSLSSLLLSYKTLSKNENKDMIFDLEQRKHPKRSKKTFEKIIINKELCRLIGYFMSEGSIKYDESGLTKEPSGLTFCFHLKEKYYTDDIKNIVGSNFGLECKEFLKEDGNSRYITFYNRQIAKFICKQFGTGAWAKIIPDWFYDISKEYFIEFMRGYIGDAKVTKKEIVYTSVNQKMIENLAYISKLHGLDCTIIKRFNKAHLSPQKTIIKDSWCYDLKFTAKYAKEIINSIENYKNSEKCPNGELLPMNVCRKYLSSRWTDKKAVSKNRLFKIAENRDDTLNKLINSDIHIVRIKSIEKLNEEIDVYDLNVPETQMFIGGNYPILLHNSEIFGGEKSPSGFQTLETRMYPNSPYAAAKLYAFHINRLYRESYGLWASSGIIFNTESPRRGEDFVTRKITKWFANYLKNGLNHKNKLQLGNVNSCRDWTHAKDCVKAIHLINTAVRPKDYLVASGETHSVLNFMQECYDCIKNIIINPYYPKLDELYEVNEIFFRPNEVPYLKGQADLIRDELGWKPEVSFKELVKEMVWHDYQEYRV